MQSSPNREAFAAGGDEIHDEARLDSSGLARLRRVPDRGQMFGPLPIQVTIVDAACRPANAAGREALAVPGALRAEGE